MINQEDFIGIAAPVTKRRLIKSFVKRARKLSPSKQKIFDVAWAQYGLNTTPNLNLLVSEKIFANDGPLNLEIGFGNGDNIFALACKHPKENFIGIEVYQPGIASLLSLLKNLPQPLNNIRIYNEDAVAVLQDCIPDQSLDKIFILFPDPWPKKRHHKRRLIQAQFILLLQKKLKSGGKLHLATDWEDYAKHINSVLNNNHDLILTCETKNSSTPDNQSPDYGRVTSTKFEQRGKKRGHQIFNWLLINK